MAYELRIIDWSSAVCSSDLEDRHPSLEPLVLQVGIEDRQRVREEQPLLDDRAAGERADVEILDLRGDHLLLDPAADEVEILFEFGLVAFLRHGTGEARKSVVEGKRVSDR